jgi:hypothetical protein
MFQNGRPATATRSDVYGTLAFGPNTQQRGSATAAVNAAAANAQATITPSDPQRALAFSMLATPAGVLVIVAAALIMFSLTD